MSGSFAYFLDAGLSTPYTSIAQALAISGSNDFELWFGSPLAAGTSYIEDNASPGVATHVHTVEDVDTRANNTPYLLGDLMKPASGTHYYLCTVPGTSHATTPPTFPTDGTTVVDGTVTWQDMGERQPVTAIKMATSQAGLDAATPGGARDTGNVYQDSGVGNADHIWVRVTDVALASARNLRIMHNEIFERPGAAPTP